MGRRLQVLPRIPSHRSVDSMMQSGFKAASAAEATAARHSERATAAFENALIALLVTHRVFELVTLVLVIRKCEGNDRVAQHTGTFTWLAAEAVHNVLFSVDDIKSWRGSCAPRIGHL